MCRAIESFLAFFLILFLVNYDIFGAEAIAQAFESESQTSLVSSPKGFIRLSFGQLSAIHQTLSVHHSKDWGFLALVQKAMATQKSQPWRCRTCMKTLKGMMPRCAWCGLPWQQCWDPTFSQEDSTRSKSASRPYHDPQGTTPWSNNQSQQEYHDWDQAHGKGQGYGRSLTPRKRSKKHRGKGQGHHSTYAANAQQAPLPAPPPISVKGEGKGHGNMKGQFNSNVMAPPPPPPLAAVAQQPYVAAHTFPQVTPQESVWVQPTGGADATVFAPMATSPSDAEVRLKSLLKELKKAPEESLTPALQEEVKKNAIREEELAAKGLHKAVDKVKKARKAVANANAARVKLMTDWRVFLQQSVVTWQEYTTMFQTQERALQEALDTAIESLTNAKKNFYEQSESLKETDPQEISDEEKEPNETDINMQPETSKRIHEGLASVVTSLQDLSEKAELEEQKAKRQRKTAEPPEDDGGDHSGQALPSMQPFGVPGRM